MMDINETTIGKAKSFLSKNWMAAAIVSSTLVTGAVAWNYSDSQLEATKHPNDKEALPYVSERNFINALNSASAMMALGSLFFGAAVTSNWVQIRRREKSKQKQLDLF